MGRNFWRYYLPAAAWAGLIFFLSAQSGSDLPKFPFPIPFADKIEHFGVYAVLAALLARAAGRGGRVSWVMVLTAVALSTAYGFSDEFHQLHVPERTFDWWDLLADFLGSCAGAAVWRRFGSQIPRPLR